MHKTMKTGRLAMMALGAVTVLGGATFAAPLNGVVKYDADQTQGQKKHELVDELDLTDAQKAQIKTIRETTRTKVEAVQADTTLSADQKSEQVKALRRDSMKQILSVLTPEQRQKLAALRAQRKQGKQDTPAA